ncbi:hypothetical protein [Brevundimonas sp.]|uniref:hypothetical protein n=1 Tax=Brevundimonas sp. TaxID=1871086 RepID=UPI002D335A4B|nr:hypothetical protein [Brevundimonas sp.]HYD28801.1 hypothetical protein [Brevundimonas sp.]
MTRRFLIFVILGLTGCQDIGRRDVKRPPAPDAEVLRTAVNPSDFWCLDASELGVEPTETEAVRRRYRHWLLCDYDRPKALRYLDVLVARNDPAAVHEKSVFIQRTDPEESERLRKLAEQLGYRPRSRMDAMREIAGLK